MTENPTFLAPGDTPAAKQGTEEDYQAFLAWRASQQNASVDPRDARTQDSAVFPDKPVDNVNAAPQTSGKGWKGGELAKPAPKPVVEEEPEPQSYIWLADGSVERVLDEDLPGHAGVGAENGHWERDGKVYQIVAVYPVEIELKKENQ